MAWDDCQISPGSVNNNEFTCSTNQGGTSLYCAFSVAQPIDQIVGLEIVVDLQHSLSSLPDYWRLGPSPDCRHDMLTANLIFSAANECKDPGFGGALVQDYLVGEPRGLQSQARIKAVAYAPSPGTVTVSNDTTYHAVRLVFSYDLSQGAASCPGCFQSACLVLNSILVRRTEGAFGGDITLTAPGPGNANWVYWRGKVGATCAQVPVRNMTWGMVKSLYR